MVPSQFSPQSRVNVRRAEGGYWAFLPPPLPPDVLLTPKLIGALSEADRAIGEATLRGFDGVLLLPSTVPAARQQ